MIVRYWVDVLSLPTNIGSVNCDVLIDNFNFHHCRLNNQEALTLTQLMYVVIFEGFWKDIEYIVSKSMVMPTCKTWATRMSVYHEFWRFSKDNEIENISLIERCTCYELVKCMQDSLKETLEVGVCMRPLNIRVTDRQFHHQCEIMTHPRQGC